MNNKEKALNEFIGKTGSIESKLEMALEFVRDHCGLGTDDINWATVGTMNHIDEKLCEVMEALSCFEK